MAKRKLFKLKKSDLNVDLQRIAVGEFWFSNDHYALKQSWLEKPCPTVDEAKVLYPKASVQALKPNELEGVEPLDGAQFWESVERLDDTGWVRDAARDGEGVTRVLEAIRFRSVFIEEDYFQRFCQGKVLWQKTDDSPEIGVQCHPIYVTDFQCRPNFAHQVCAIIMPKMRAVTSGIEIQ